MKQFSRLVPDLPRGTTAHGLACMERCRELMLTKKPPGTWWAHEVLAKIARKEPVTVSAEALARSALEREPEREPERERQAGEDWEEDENS